jgi:hypothetical protein
LGRSVVIGNGGRVVLGVLDVLGKGGYWRKSRISLGIRVGIEELALDLE